MKKILLVVGIICLIACVLAFVFFAFSCFGYYHVLDGSAELFARLHRRMIVSFVIGIVFAVLGIAGLVIRTKI